MRLILRLPVRKPCGATCPTSHSLRRYSTSFWMLGPRDSFRASQGNEFGVVWNETLTCYPQNMDTDEAIPGPSSAIVFYLSETEAPITSEACLASLRSNWEGRQTDSRSRRRNFLPLLINTFLPLPMRGLDKSGHGWSKTLPGSHNTQMSRRSFGGSMSWQRS
jgi:hypothetical protein